MSATPDPDRPNRRRFGLIVSLLTVLIVLVAAEVGLRIYAHHFAPRHRAARWLRVGDLPAHALKYESHPYLCYSLNPDFRTDDGLDRHNSLGFRGEEPTVAKAPGRFRIVCVGGSSTYDTEIPDWRDAYPVQLERILRETHGRENVEVLNCGIPGYTSFESLINLEMRVLPLQPDLVVVYHAVNDVHARLVPPEWYRRDNTGYRHAWTERQYWWDHSMLLHIIGVQAGFSQRNRLRDWVLTLDDRPPADVRAQWLAANPPTHFRRNLVAMHALAGSAGARTVFLSWAFSGKMDDYASDPSYQQGFREHNDVIREVALATGSPFFDLASQLPDDPELWDDGRHSNATGALRKAELVADFLHREVLETP